MVCAYHNYHIILYSLRREAGAEELVEVPALRPAIVRPLHRAEEQDL